MPTPSLSGRWTATSRSARASSRTAAAAAPPRTAAATAARSLASPAPTATPVSGGADIEFTSVGAMQFQSGSQFIAAPGGMIVLTHPPAVVPQKAGATFNPPPIDNPKPLGSTVYPNCPVCGDGI